MHWTKLYGDKSCAKYGAREYHATLVDVPWGREWLELCEGMPITIHDRVLERPNRCERTVRVHSTPYGFLLVSDNGHQKDGQVLGHWLITDELDCKPHWGELKDLVSF